jgi:hypothetical protein
MIGDRGHDRLEVEELYTCPNEIHLEIPTTTKLKIELKGRADRYRNIARCNM